MKFIISSALLKKAMNRVSPLIATNAIMPILENVLMEVVAGESILRLRTTDLNATMTTSVPIDDMSAQTSTGRPFMVCCPAALLKETLAVLPEQPLIFEMNPETNRIEIKTDNGVFRLMGEGVSFFPKDIVKGRYSALEPGVGGMLKMSPSQLKAIQTKVCPFASTDATLAVLTGVYTEFSSSGTSFVATNRSALVKLVDATLSFSSVHQAINIPARAFKLALNLFTDSEETVVVSWGSTQVVFANKESTLSIQLIGENGSQFPPYHPLLTESKQASLCLNRAGLLATLRRIKFFSDSSSYVAVSLHPKQPQLIVLDAVNPLDPERGAVENLIGEYEGRETIQLGFGVKSLTELLGAVDYPRIKIGLSAPNKSVLIYEETTGTGVEELSYCQLLMPVMLPKG